MDVKPQNPLFKHFRQPAIHIKLPSEGQYWPAGSIEIPQTGELPIYPLTTRDELTLRTPDALMNGSSVVDVVQSCCPSVKNAWDMPSTDVDALLIAIRIASYGHELEVGATCPECKETNDYAIDLRGSLDKIQTPDYKTPIVYQELRIKLKPQPYFSVNKVNMLRFEEQQMIAQITNMDLSEEQRAENFKKQLQKIADLNLEVITDSTEYIQTEDNTVVTDREFILDFYRNADSRVVKTIQNSFAELNKLSGAKSEAIKCGSCGHVFHTQIEYDYANFFAIGS